MPSAWLTPCDIPGEKSQQYMEFTGCDHDDVLARYIMQEIIGWCVADIQDRGDRAIRGRDVREVFNETGVAHLPVMETKKNNEPRLRGLLSFARVKRLACPTIIAMENPESRQRIC